MIVKGKSRGDAVQLANYLLDKRDNEEIRVLGIHGTATPNDLKRSLIEMELTVELTDGTKGLHHGQIAPRPHEAVAMTDKDWHYCIETYAKFNELEGQKWAAVLHTKNGSTHAHLVFERYDHDTGTLRRDNFNYYKNNKARHEIEAALGHAPTPWRRDKTQEVDHKKTLTEIWDFSKDGVEFIEHAEAIGYQVAKGLDRRPYKVITQDGKSLDLVRQLDGIKTAEVKKQLDQIRLQTEAEALHKITVEKRQSVKETRVVFEENKTDIQPTIPEPEPEMEPDKWERQRRLYEMRKNLDQGHSY
ncbi:relaxase/mobilization nuclease domain-containing protein [Dyadobacter sp. CY327]|uniref:relaxase/mobilization nuclease domain-containing protein n=1 Tax=Dyadobacter sp. CY327 TaxID=2907301 RepID=UPI001F21B968|nr:relaxase/mobilization nuclease domain-containing protein [Dyadobacter sp. CY327]MCE7073703.1 relaxase/mobilization nuclease domain-containing protein [Dyadobacter sp. CY327]